MLVYGDQLRQAMTGDLLCEIASEYHAVEAMPAGIERHGRLVGVFIVAGQLAQGLADAEMQRYGHDCRSDMQHQAMALAGTLAASVIQSWTGKFDVKLPHAPWAELAAMKLPGCLMLRQPEGYAFYAVYPEAYAMAAFSLGQVAVRVIGVRSIGTGLAAIVAAALRAPSPDTVRPVGYPFQRELALSPGLAAALADGPNAVRIIVDEGPGLSGSTFGAVAGWLVQACVPESRIICLPGHAAEPGAMAQPEHLARWRRLRREVVSFDDLVLRATKDEHRLENWFDDLVGTPIGELTDISGGAWRGAREIAAPVSPSQERRKFLLRTSQGTFLLKFAGLGTIGKEKFERARKLAEAGFTPQPYGLRHGFLIETWHGNALVPDMAGGQMLDLLGQYLGFRATSFPADQGASLHALANMARQNIGEVFGPAAAANLRLSMDRQVQAIHVDARLHRWEWLIQDGKLLKTDALDHSCGHDLVGCQDVAWDIAGAIVEFDLTPNEGEQLCQLVCTHGQKGVDRVLVTDCVIYYCAYQLGVWMQAPTVTLSRYRDRLSQILC